MDKRPRQYHGALDWVDLEGLVGVEHFRIGAFRFALGLLLGLTSLGLAESARAGAFEVSAGFSYTRALYGDETSYSWNRRWGGSVGYRFTEVSELELAFQDSLDRTMIEDYEDTTFHDRIYSLNWVQSLLPRSYFIQPYLKAGIAQLNRDASGSYFGGGTPPARIDALTGVAGAGFRVYFTRTAALRTESVSYLRGGDPATWAENIATTIGISWSL